MSIHGFALFSLVYLLATATPGPGIGAILARVIARGTAGIGFSIAGFIALLPTVIDLTRLNRGTGTVVAGAAIVVATR
jgi:threonine/homoserine/homoserine lactone efflux protein